MIFLSCLNQSICMPCIMPCLYATFKRSPFVYPNYFYYPTESKMLRNLRRLTHPSFSLLSRTLFSKSYLLKNGRVVNSDYSQQADVLISDGKIKEVGSITSSLSDVETIDCSKKLIIPGGIDTHTHMQLPFMGTDSKDDFNIGSKAAVIGGTTSFIDFVIPEKGESLDAAYKRWRDKADGKVNCDYALHCAIIEWNDNTPEQMKSMVNCGISSFKFFMAYNKVLRVDDTTLYKAFEVARDLGAICLVHAENGDLIEVNQQKLAKLGITGPEGHYLSRPQSIEADAVHRVLTIAQHANCPVYIAHLMSKSSVDEVLRAKLRGNLVFGETLAASIGIDGKGLWNSSWDVASRYVMSPPISPDPTTKTYLMKMLHNHVIDVVGTDNCTFCTEQKRMGKDDFRKIPNGVNGIEDRMAVVWTKGVRAGLLSENEFVRATSTQAARLFNMYPRKGVIRKGADADVVVWNPKEKKVISKDTHHQNIDYNVFQGLEVYGRADYTFAGGQLAWDGSKFNEKVKGKYVSRKPFGYAYARHKYWTEEHNPLKFKVERSESGDNKKTTKEEQLQKDIAKLTNENRELQKECARLKSLDENKKTEENQYSAEGEFKGVDGALKTYLPLRVYESVRQILYGSQCEEPALSKEASAYANKNDFQIQNYKITALKEQLRPQRKVKIAAIQNKIIKPTTDPIKVQKQAIIDRVLQMVHAAALQKANIVCTQQIWNAPFFMCTRQRYPWIEFSEPVNGESTKILAEIAKKHNMVIISSILERCDVKGTLHNSAVVIDNYGEVLGKQIKGHIPRVGDFNESTYYMEGDSGHPVFDTDFGKIGINICYGRHHPLNWLGFGINGAEIVFNPSATIGGLSEPLWAIEARNAAIANHYFAVGINRIGTEVYPHPFTSGDGKSAHKNFGHFYGSTYVAAPDGARTPSLSRDRQGLLLTTVDLNLCQQTKDKWGFTMTARYPDYAELLTKFSKPGYTQQVIRGRRKDNTSS